MSKKDRRALASQFEVGANLSGIVMKVSPEDKKIILFKEELAGRGNTIAADEVKVFKESADRYWWENRNSQELLIMLRMPKRRKVL